MLESGRVKQPLVAVEYGLCAGMGGNPKNDDG